MSQVSDYTLSNIGFSAFRTELNSILNASNTLNAPRPVTLPVFSGVFQLSPTKDIEAKLYISSGSDSFIHLHKEFWSV